MLHRGPRIGIDPGAASGKIAVVTDTDVLDVRSMPRRDNGDLDAVALADLLGTLRAVHCAPAIYCEQIGLHTGDRAKLGAAMLGFYEAFGALKAVLQAHGDAVTYIAPGSWKSRVGLRSTKGLKVPKDASRDVALAIFGASAFRHVRRNTNAADACLIGYVGPQFDSRVIEPIAHSHAQENPF